MNARRSYPTRRFCARPRMVCSFNSHQADIWYGDYDPLFYGMKPRLTEKKQLIQNHIIIESRVKISLQVFFLLKHDFFLLCYTVKSQMTNHLSSPVSLSPLPPFFFLGFLPALTPLPFIPPSIQSCLSSPFNTHISKKEVQVTDWFLILEFKDLQELSLGKIDPLLQSLCNIFRLISSVFP